MKYFGSEKMKVIRDEVFNKGYKVADQDETIKVSFNPDPISKETYIRIFEKLIEKDAVVLNIGAGFAIDPVGGLNSLNETVLAECEEKGARLLIIDLEKGNLFSHQDLKEAVQAESLLPIYALGQKLPLSDASVSGIVTSNLINCPAPNLTLKDQAAELITEAFRVLRPGGFILISSFGYILESISSSGEKQYNNDLKERDLFTLKQLEHMLDSKGFVRISELEVDSDREHSIQEKLLLTEPMRDAGGFIAYKPR